MSTSALTYAAATELRSRLAPRELGALELLEACLARIDAVNPAVNAIVTLCPDEARVRARARWWPGPGGVEVSTSRDPSVGGCTDTRARGYARARADLWVSVVRGVSVHSY